MLTRSQLKMFITRLKRNYILNFGETLKMYKCSRDAGEDFIPIDQINKRDEEFDYLFQIILYGATSYTESTLC